MRIVMVVLLGAVLTLGLLLTKDRSPTAAAVTHPEPVAEPAHGRLAG